MDGYSDFVVLLLKAEGLRRLIPSEVADLQWLLKLRQTDAETISGGRAVLDADAAALVRGGLFYALDAIEEAHRIFQDAPGDLGAYWHGMMHRREGDFDNARYWFRRAGRLNFFDALHREAANVEATMARQLSWDPYLFTGMCEQAKYGEEETLPALLKLQRLEFEVLFAYCWRRAYGAA